VKPCHIVTLALTVWLLMLPPATVQDRRLIFEPVANWKLLDTFGTQADCERMRELLMERMPGTAIDTTQCVSSHDERFKRNPEIQPKVGERESSEGMIWN